MFAGIDLGTTCSVLAILDEFGNPSVVPNADGDRITPSVVFLDRDNVAQVGTEAENRAGEDDARCIFEIKRHMGSEHRVVVDAKNWTPTELSALILKKLATECSPTGKSITSAVITVPASFGEPHRAATMDAGRLAGLNVLGIINEPTAAAVYYSHAQGIQGNVLVYDLGGGTFDATVLTVRGDDVRVLTNQGVRNLGGTDFDRLLVSRSREQYLEEAGGPLVDTPEGENELRLEKMRDRIKHSLSRRDKAGVSLQGESHPEAIRFEFTREQFDQEIDTRVERTIMLVEQAMGDAKLEFSDLDHVILVGGSSRIPLVQKRLTDVCGQSPTIDPSLDEAVALGAAIHAGRLLMRKDASLLTAGQRAELAKKKVVEVADHYFGTLAVTHAQETLPGAAPAMELRNFILIEKDTPLPCEKSDSYNTIYDGQDLIRVKVTQSLEATDDPELVETVGSFEFALPSGRPAGCEVWLTYGYDENGRMTAHVRDTESGREKSVEVLNGSSSSGSTGSEARAAPKLEDWVVE